MGSKFFLHFGRVEFVVQAAPGSGIVSSMILFSDSLDEVDWEFRGSYPTIVQTNWFGRGIYGDYRHATSPTVSNAFTSFHTYTLDWSPTELVWLIDGKVVRSLKAADCKGGAGTSEQYPTGPMKVSLGLWDPGDPDNYNSWGGGKTPIPPPAGGYTFFVKSVKIWNSNPAQLYHYKDRTGDAASIMGLNDTIYSKGAANTSPRLSSTLKSSTSATSAKSSPAPVSQSSKSSVSTTAIVSTSAKSSSVPVSQSSKLPASSTSMLAISAKSSSEPVSQGPKSSASAAPMLSTTAKSSSVPLEVVRFNLCNVLYDHQTFLYACKRKLEVVSINHCNGFHRRQIFLCAYEPYGHVVNAYHFYDFFIHERSR
ncbi:MAG: hypothetical protein Q9164_005378 [Protoblastenia rupestris]